MLNSFKLLKGKTPLKMTCTEYNLIPNWVNSQVHSYVQLQISVLSGVNYQCQNLDFDDCNFWLCKRMCCLKETHCFLSVGSGGWNVCVLVNKKITRKHL